MIGLRYVSGELEKIQRELYGKTREPCRRVKTVQSKNRRAICAEDPRVSDESHARHVFHVA